MAGDAGSRGVHGVPAIHASRRSFREALELRSEHPAGGNAPEEVSVPKGGCKTCRRRDRGDGAVLGGGAFLARSHFAVEKGPPPNRHGGPTWEHHARKPMRFADVQTVSDWRPDVDRPPEHYVDRDVGVGLGALTEADRG